MQRLRFVPPWLSPRQTDRQTHTHIHTQGPYVTSLFGKSDHEHRYVRRHQYSDAHRIYMYAHKVLTQAQPSLEHYHAVGCCSVVLLLTTGCDCCCDPD